MSFCQLFQKTKTQKQKYASVTFRTMEIIRSLYWPATLFCVVYKLEELPAKLISLSSSSDHLLS